MAHYRYNGVLRGAISHNIFQYLKIDILFSRIEHADFEHNIERVDSTLTRRPIDVGITEFEWNMVFEMSWKSVVEKEYIFPSAGSISKVSNLTPPGLTQTKYDFNTICLTIECSWFWDNRLFWVHFL